MPEVRVQIYTTDGIEVEDPALSGITVYLDDEPHKSFLTSRLAKKYLSTPIDLRVVSVFTKEIPAVEVQKEVALIMHGFGQYVEVPFPDFGDD